MSTPFNTPQKEEGFPAAKYGRPVNLKKGGMSPGLNPDDSNDNEPGDEVAKGAPSYDYFNVAEARKKISNLQNYANTPINKLPPGAYQDYNYVVKSVRSLYNTDNFSTLRGIVDEYFTNVTHPEPGTVGAYMVGCVVSTNFPSSNQGCSAICAGGIPPDDDVWKSCQYTVIVANMKDDKFEFRVMYRPDTAAGKETAYVFVQYSDINSFPGFSASEKQELGKLGIKRVVLYGFRDGTNYHELSNTNLSDIKERLAAGQADPPSNNWGWEIGLAIVLVVLALFVIFLIYRYYQGNQNSQKRQ